MKKRLLLTIISFLALLGMNTGLVSAHELKDHSADCETVTGNFKNFPDGTNQITVTGVSSVVKSFTGSSGSVSATWSELGVDTGDGLPHTYSFSWTADGGGQAGPFTFDAKDCKKEPPKECPEGQTGTPPNCETPPPTTTKKKDPSRQSYTCYTCCSRER